MIDPVSFLLFILCVVALANLTGAHPILRYIWAVVPGCLLLFITHQAALVLALAAIVFNIGIYAICRSLGKARVSARLPYLILLLLFVPDLMGLFRDAPVLWLGSAFFIIRQMMTTTQAVKKGVTLSDYLPALGLASFFFAAIPSGPVFNGLDTLKALKERRAPDNTEGLYRIGEGFIFLFAIAGFCGMALAQVHVLETQQAQAGNLVAFAFLRYLALPLVGFGFLFATFYGYSRMAEGTALTLGFTVPQNFNKPHLARDLGDYWKRWHRSMADFVMQYIYLPLIVSSGNSKLALVAAFTFMGIWHNLSVGFLIWGLGHGVALGYALPWARKHMNPALLRSLSLSYVVFLSAIAHGVWTA